MLLRRFYVQENGKGNGYSGRPKIWTFIDGLKPLSRIQGNASSTLRLLPYAEAEVNP